MGIEIEYKFRLDDPAPYRERLRAAGAELGGRFHESDHIFDTADCRLLAADCGLRLRTRRPCEDPAAAPVHTLTYKGPRDGGVPKTRAEVETGVADSAALRTILGSLGYQEVVAYEKQREVWRWGGCVVMLDQLPRLGWWLEIEGPDGATIERTRAALGLDAAAPARETYVELAAAHGETGPAGTRSLRFT